MKGNYAKRKNTEVSKNVADYGLISSPCSTEVGGVQTVGSSKVKSQRSFFAIIPQLTADLCLDPRVYIHFEDNKYQIYFFNKTKEKKALREIIL